MSQKNYRQFLKNVLQKSGIVDLYPFKIYNTKQRVYQVLLEDINS